MNSNSDKYFQANRKNWDAWTPSHAESPFYNLAGFKAGKDRLRSIELEELGSVQGKSLLHLQCHFGLDTLAWARRGAEVTGVDFSKESIALARALSEELKIPARFVCVEISNLPNELSGEFDIVFTSYGVLHWLPDLNRWAQVIAHFLKPQGIFYIVEDHPTFRMLGSDATNGLRPENSYFHSTKPTPLESEGSYASEDAGHSAYYLWNHSLGEVITCLVNAGLRIEFLREFPYAARAKFPFMEQGADGWWRLPAGYSEIPFLFSLQARKPG